MYTDSECTELEVETHDDRWPQLRTLMVLAVIPPFKIAMLQQLIKMSKSELVELKLCVWQEPFFKSSIPNKTL